MRPYADIFAERLNSNQILQNEPLSRHSSFKVGGPADYLLLPSNNEELSFILRVCTEHGIRFDIIGNGSNILFADNGYKGVLIKIGKAFSNISVNGNLVTAGAGCTLSALFNETQRHSLTGLEFASGIPGTLGGAIFMNAGAYDGEIKDLFVSAVVMDMNGNITIKNNIDMGFGYRHSILQQDLGIVTEAVLSLKHGDAAAIKAKADDFNARRRDKQPLEYPSAGSTFKRPHGHFAGKLIMESGLAGFMIGGAAVSEKHCGFIINRDNATTEDILRLMEHVRKTVWDRFGVMLEPEVRYLPESLPERS